MHEQSLDNCTMPMWPRIISCNMNIREWVDSMTNNGLLETYQGIIDGFSNGFDQGIPHHTLRNINWCSPPNHKSADWARSEIEATFAKEIAAKRLYGPFTFDQVHLKYRFFRTSPMRAVIQWRWLTKTNIRLVISKKSKSLNSIYTAVAFGGVEGCGTFGRVADAWRDIILHEFNLVNIFRWVDDALFLKEVNEVLHMETIIERSQKLGVKTNTKKRSPFAPGQRFLGFIWNAVKKTVRLPDAQLQERREQIRSALEPSRRFILTEVEVLAGRLNHWVKNAAMREAPLDVIQDLEQWLNVLNMFTNTRLTAPSEPLNLEWVGDASTSYGIGMFIGKKWAQFQFQKRVEKL
ncbi:hypothetical protein CROQUDRAFT_714962 [Cronartium quercuum f. sp. fusiforme G11]|uniref:Reverse transcriptase domain-containing protein n=1 Tax=Cronartium quercuum f. sp. fusiforme G11 TaxID=708437 RepID=A0A9P6TDE5_9BASI|nr:hypothetical protein CROQUDRAFT_714962 [Cronartium quercuum f. sp. fusiforme G11]